MSARRTWTLIGLVVAVVALAAFATAAPGKMRSKKLGPDLCETTGGGRFVPIPGFPGERIDRRLLPDVRYLIRRYKIFITDGYSHDAVHAANGEHPLGLALDIVPNTAAGGSWRLISKLAKHAEPHQNQPIAPWRWVGYNGDAGHGRGNHLHLSWNHSDARPYHPARSVYTMRCPGSRGGGNAGGGRKGDGPGKDGGGRKEHKGPGGGVRPGGGGGESGAIGPGRGGDDGDRAGGLQPRLGAAFERDAADPVVETGGVGLR